MRRMSLAFFSIVLVGVAAMMLLGPLRSLGQDATPATVSCGAASPIARSGAVPGTATPMVQETDAALVGTPVITSCLQVTLQADSTEAGPVTLTVAVVDPTSGPVGDAHVTIESRHTTMDHGTSTYDATPTARGVYVVEAAALGMGGAWEVRVTIIRPGQEPITVLYRVDMVGPE